MDKTTQILPSELVKLARQQERLEILNKLQLEMNEELKKHDGEPTQRFFTLKDIEKLINNKK